MFDKYIYNDSGGGGDPLFSSMFFEDENQQDEKFVAAAMYKDMYPEENDCLIAKNTRENCYRSLCL